MSRSGTVRAATLALVLAAAGALGAQEEAPRTRLVFGPCLGISAAIMDPGDFNGQVQALLSDSSRTFFPVFTQMGVQLQQLLPLGGTGSYLAFQQTLLVGGLEQSMPLPSGSMTIGCRLPFGLELGLGPYVTVTADGGSPHFVLAVAYRAGWVFSFPGFTVPVAVQFVPLPRYASPQVSVISGIGFETLQ
jgi:hypothetical protein